MELDITEAVEPGNPNVIAIRINTGLVPAYAAEGLASRLFLYAPADWSGAKMCMVCDRLRVACSARRPAG